MQSHGCWIWKVLATFEEEVEWLIFFRLVRRKEKTWASDWFGTHPYTERSATILLTVIHPYPSHCAGPTFATAEPENMQLTLPTQVAFEFDPFCPPYLDQYLVHKLH